MLAITCVLWTLSCSIACFARSLKPHGAVKPAGLPLASTRTLTHEGFCFSGSLLSILHILVAHTARSLWHANHWKLIGLTGSNEASSTIEAALGCARPPGTCVINHQVHVLLTALGAMPSLRLVRWIPCWHSCMAARPGLHAEKPHLRLQTWQPAVPPALGTLSCCCRSVLILPSCTPIWNS